MKRKVLRILLVILIANCEYIAAQYPLDTKKIISSNPEAAALGRYGDYPVSLNTGLVNISIPLFEISTKKITLPLSLSYHASGIRVDDIASSVGLGWVLNAGGCIARTKCDKDDMYYGSFFTAGKINNTSSTISKEEHLYSLGTGDKSYDSESDIYSYNFNGYTGQFRYNDLGEIVSSSQEGLKISGTQKDGYTIITPDGISYFFNMQELTSSNGGTQYTSAWFLTKITDLNNQEEINFSYDVVQYQATDVFPSESYMTFQGFTNQFCSCQPPTPNSYNWVQVLTMHALTGITYPSGSVKIAVALDRQDVRNHRVSKIQLFSNTNNIQSVEDIQFYHSYFTTTQPPSGAPVDTRKTCRLRLDSVRVNADKAYRFNYNSTPLPHYYMTNGCYQNPTYYYGQDEWGYYNGQWQCTLLPEHNYAFGKANRSTVESFMKACSLEEIIYPTGGKTHFEFEANTGITGPVGGLRIKKVLNYSSYKSLTPIKTIAYGYSTGQLCPYSQWYINRWSYGGQYYYCNCNSIENYYVTNYSSAPLFPNTYNNGTIVYYATVTDTVSSSNNAIYANKYTYLIDEPYYRLTPASFQYPYWSSSFNHLNVIAAKEQNFKSGQLLSHTIYKNTNGIFNILQDTQNEWTTYAIKDNIVGMKIQVRTLTDLYHPGYDERDSVSANFHYYDIIMQSGEKKMTSSVIKNYTDDGGIMVETLKYYYDGIDSQPIGKRSFQPSREEKTNSNGDTYITEYKRAYQYETPNYQSSGKESEAIQNLLKMNLLDPVIEKITYLKAKGTTVQKLINSEINTYETQGTFTLPKQVLHSAISQVKTNYTGSSIDTNNSFAYDATMFTRDMLYDMFDTKGNILQYTGKNNIPTTILWSYNYQYPVAKIDGISYNNVTSILTQNFIDNLAATAAPTTYQLNSIRTMLASKTALVNGYMYKPLVGLTSIINPRGATTSYTYDVFNRLYLSRNDDKNIINRYRYGYQNAPDNGRGGYTAISAIITPGATSYSPGVTGTATLSSVSGGTGGYTYSWYLKNSSGGILSSYENTTIPSFSYPCSQTGTLTIQCIVTDSQTGISTTASTTINCAPISITGVMTMQTGFTRITGHITSNGTAGSFYLIFYPGTTMQVGVNYLVANISSNCRPIAQRGTSYSSEGRLWRITINANGDVYLRIDGGATLLSNGVATMNMDYTI